MRHGAPQQQRRMRHRNNGGNNTHVSQSQGNNRRGFQNKNRVLDSNGPDVRIRGTAFQIVEKYAALAKDAHSAGDLVLYESYLQHAEHYQRMINQWNEEFGFDDQQPSGQFDRGEAPQPAGTEPQPDLAAPNEEEDLGLPSSIIGTKSVARPTTEEVA